MFGMKITTTKHRDSDFSTVNVWACYGRWANHRHGVARKCLNWFDVPKRDSRNLLNSWEIKLLLNDNYRETY